ncbi:MAG TPA: efflux RND transporter periplasmic adaptor subunit [Polyangiaceae bacterium]|jgi:membrane fusion protein (multidrug efflux system)|nr:efflux RND transporter periplasmic adaptor subunit [Polyangiaceae bacterium]
MASTERIDLMASESSKNEPKSVKAPLGGIVVVIVLAAVFAVWTGMRIVSATKAQQAVAAKRDQEAARTQAEMNAPKQVRVAAPVQQTWQPAVEFDGTLAAMQSAGLGFKVGGRISALRVHVGDAVKAGALLATLDATEAAAQLRAAEAQTRAADVQLKVAQDDEHRTTQMVASGSIAEAAGVQSTQKSALATAQLDAARAQAALAQVTLSNHSLLAPFAGTVTKVPDGIGAVVAPGAMQFEIVDVRSLKLKSTVSESDADLLAKGAAVEIETPSGSVTGVLSAVLSSVDQSTRRVPVEAVVDNKDGKLRSGSFVRARVEGGSPISVLKLPQTVLRPGSQDEIFTVDGDALRSHHVILAVDKDGSLLVRGGLTANARVLLSPSAEAKEGDHVVVQAP